MKIINKLINKIIQLFGYQIVKISSHKSSLVSQRQDDVHSIPIISTCLNNIEVKFACESRNEKSRIEAYSSATKEPETYEWIDRFVKSGDILYDIGSNIGGYSLYSIKKHNNLKVYCFDPDPQNITQLNKNIFINGAIEKMTAYCICITDKDYIAELNLADKGALFKAGYSGNMIDTDINRIGKQIIAAKTGSIQLSLDTLIGRYGFPCPNHIKIDVDGGEDRVVLGAKRTLMNENIRTILIELDYNNLKMINTILQMGFKEFTSYTNAIYYEMEKKEHIPAGMGNKVFIRD